MRKAFHDGRRVRTHASGQSRNGAVTNCSTVQLGCITKFYVERANRCKQSVLVEAVCIDLKCIELLQASSNILDRVFNRYAIEMFFLWLMKRQIYFSCLYIGRFSLFIPSLHQVLDSDCSGGLTSQEFQVAIKKLVSIWRSWLSIFSLYRLLRTAFCASPFSF